jgi:hypothetical protein
LGLPAQAIQFQLDQAQSKVHAGTISALAYDNPRAASNYMESHKSEILGTDRLQLEQQIDASRRRIMAEQEHAVIMQDRADRLKAETVTKDLDGKLADGTLTRGEVDQQKDTLDESHYRYFVETLAKGGAGVEAKDMPEVAGPLFSRWVAGENVDGDANAAYRLGHISFETYRTITQREKSPAVQRGYEVIKATVGASALNATPDAQSALVLGNKDFAEWLRGHPSATDVEIADTARYFGNHYRATEAGKYRSNMPAPRYLVGAISGTPQQINLWETVRRANEAHARGELTDEQYADEAMRIQNVRDVIMRESGGVDDEGNPRTPYDPLGPNAPGYIAPPPTHPHTPTPNRLAVPGVPGATIGGTGTTVYGRIH